MAIEKPELKPHLAFARIDAENGVIRGDGTASAISGRLYVDLLSAMDGNITRDALVDRLSDDHQPELVLFAIDALARRGLLCDAAERSGWRRDADAWWHEIGGDPVAAARRIEGGSVRVVGVGATGDAAARAVAQLSAQGVRLDDDGRLVLLVTDDYLDSDLAALTDEARRAGRNVLLVRPAGVQAWIGPLLTPGGPCWECLAFRLRAARWVDGDLARRTGLAASLPATASLDITRDAVVALAVAEALKHLAGHGTLADTLLTLNTATLETQRHRLLPVPGCATCGGTAAHRTGDGDIDGFAHLVSPLLGIVPEPRALASGPGAPAHILYVPQPMIGDAASPGRGLAPRDGAFGKGLDRAQARTGCLGEAVERYSTMYRLSDLGTTASLCTLGATALDPRALLGFSDRQHADRVAWNRRHGGYNWVPPLFDADAPVDWTVAHSLVGADQRLVPTAYVYFGTPATAGRRFMRADSNGCAAGPSITDAKLRALLELVERDAVAIWWYNRLSRAQVDLDSFRDERLERFARWADAQDRDLWVLDIGTDLAVPTFVAVSAERGGGNIAFGFGCHWDPIAAILSAMTEMYQMSVLFRLGTEDGTIDPSSPIQRAVVRWLTEATLDQQTYLRPSGVRTAEHYAGMRAAARPDPLGYLLGLLDAGGLSAWWLDLTREDVGIPVVRAIVPGLRHFWARLGPGRLYDVPVALGLLDRPHAEEELNPIPMFV